jgi:hypothetical protein
MNYAYICNNKKYVLNDDQETKVVAGVFFVICDKCNKAKVTHILNRQDS